MGKIFVEKGPYDNYSYQEVGFSWDWGSEEKIKQEISQKRQGDGNGTAKQ